MNKKLNPFTCELQVGDVVEVISGGNKLAKIINVKSQYKFPYLLESERLIIGRCNRSELRLISRNGKTII